jgi:hypothetical protein
MKASFNLVASKVIFFCFLWNLWLPVGLANVEFYAENNVFRYNSIESCKSDEYFDVNFLKCSHCASNLAQIGTNTSHLIASKDGNFMLKIMVFFPLAGCMFRSYLVDCAVY